ncbi:o-succinylbenzoate synthase [Aquihabitans sp. G128]|uniref:enolase C-terminal domain-like protein n=1 Tax=Aquihabitans sp. G128 TaxID=2849779 RepID=UPI001C233FB6|nr:enolase C-terminal domain-like protein [Aquihabitans sp. G128]QXC62281.1 o-succinylbenzoate synthase [Aquihabitans sp. G128]
MSEPLVEVELVRVRVPLRQPLRSAHGEEAVRDLVLVRAGLADGTSGWGECSALARPTYTGEHTAGAWAVLLEELVPAALEGRDAGVVGHPMATAALATARLDAALRGRGRRLVEHLGAAHGRPRERVAVTAVVGRAEAIDDLLALVAEHVAAGVALVKLKVTPHPADLAAVAAVRAAWPDLPLAVDGNGSLDNRSLSILAESDLAYVEQPAPAEDLLTSAAMAKRVGVPIALDESITSLGALETALTVGAGSIVNLKPGRVGGLDVAADLARTAFDAGCGVFVGGMLETGVGRAAAAALAALPACTLPTDLGPSSRYVEHELTEEVEVDADGHLLVPAGPGIGVTPIPERLDAVAVDRSLRCR